jgi:hypothetical protein
MTKAGKEVNSLAIKVGIQRSNSFFKRALFPRHQKRKEKKTINIVTNNILEECLIDHDIDHNMEEDTKDNFETDFFFDPVYFEEDIEDMQFENYNQLPNMMIDDNSDWVSAVDLQIPSFDMKKLSKNLSMSSNKSSFLMQDDNKKLIHGGNVSKGSFSRSIHEWASENNVKSSGIDTLMNILSKTFKGYELPVKKVTTTTEVRFNTLNEFKNVNRIKYEASVIDNLEQTFSDEDCEDFDDTASLRTEDLSCDVVNSSTVHEYTRKSTRYVAVDQCECDRYVYAGLNNQFSCPKCGKNRFRPCTRNQCSGNGGNNCEHLRSANGDGISYKQLFYRPLLVLISDLLRTPNFLRSLRYEREDKHLSSDQHQSQRIYSDLMDGDEVQHHLSEMRLRYMDWIKSKPERTHSEEVSLVLSEFYDGGQLFKSKTYNFWILMTQILNLPPTFRGKLGIGMFLSAIYSGRHLEAEKFLFTDMYCEELRLLYEGTEIHLKGKRYFIQARLILHTLDTKALEAVLCLQSASMASYGCPLCRCITGVHDGSKPVYIGHRNTLPLNSYLRFIGQSGKCCPAGFYDNKKKQFDSNSETYPYGAESFSVEDHEGYKKIRIRMQRELERYYQLNQSAKTNKKFNQDESDRLVRPITWETVQNLPGTLHFLQFCLPCDGDKRNENAIKKFLFVHEHINYYWSNENPKLFDICKKDTGLRKYLIYRHFDLRSYKPYERVSYKDHLENAIHARSLNEKNKTQTKKHCEGIQDVWPFERLPYANISQQVTWPFLHSICGVINLLVDLIFGEIEVQESILKETTDNEQAKKPSSIIEFSDEEDGGGDDDPNNWEDDEESKTLATNNNKEKHKTVEPKKESMRRKKAIKMATFYRFRTLQPRNRKQPYESDPADRKKCREWFQCIILPKGLGDDSWNMRKFIINDKKLIQGYMKMNQKLKLISCFWDFILLAMSGIEDQYKVFYSMVGSNLRKLQSNYFSSEDVVKLARDIEEMVCMWEGLLPLKTCTFILHELIDLAPFIKHFGPPMGVSEFPGERAVGALINRKLKCNAGGGSFENLVVDRHIDFELRKIKKFYSSKDLSELNGACIYSSTGKCIYNGERYNISKPETKTSRQNHKCTKLTEYELDLLNDTLLLEVELLYGSDNRDICCKNSIVYNLEAKRRETFKNDSSVSEWLRFVTKNENGSFSDEEVVVSTNLLGLNPDFFQNATISGLLFHSRGSWKRETIRPTRDGVYGSGQLVFKGSKYSELRQNFRDKADYSSWCIFKHSNHAKHYAQINAFFQIQVGDKSLDGLIVASVTSRNYQYKSKYNLVKIIASNSSLNSNILFVTIKDIYPTRIATIPFAKNGIAINIKSNVLMMNCKYSTSYFDSLVELYMFTLHPERLTFRMD